MQEVVLELLPEQEPWLISEALIELGATVCTKTPKCFACPLSISCKGFLAGKTQELPVKTVKTVTTSLFRSVAVIVCNGHILAGKEEKGKIMADLFQFPYKELENSEADIHLHRKWIQEELEISANWQHTLFPVKHSFTRYRALLIPHLYQAKECREVKGYQWHSLEELKKLPFSSGHKKILLQLRNELFS